jgi:hypothetical protein
MDCKNDSLEIKKRGLALLLPKAKICVDASQTTLAIYRFLNNLSIPDGIGIVIPN